MTCTSNRSGEFHSKPQMSPCWWHQDYSLNEKSVCFACIMSTTAPVRQDKESLATTLDCLSLWPTLISLILWFVSVSRSSCFVMLSGEEPHWDPPQPAGQRWTECEGRYWSNWTKIFSEPRHHKTVIWLVTVSHAFWELDHWNSDYI